MSTMTSTPARPGRELSGQVPLSRLLRVELRKLVDTRSGRWLLIGIAVLTAAVVTIFLFAAPPEELTYENFVTATGTPQGVLLPILGILTVTSEWGQRTGLVTFTLEPKRGRVVVAKLLAVLLLGLAAVLVAFGLAALGNVLGQSLQDGDGSWTFGAEGFRDILVLQLLGVLQGLALGMLIMNTAGAIVTYFALPAAVSILVGTVTAVRDAAEWFDINTASLPLSEHTADGGDWARLAVAALIWVVVPMALGWFRLLHRELKSA
jgi:ABC-type transport system involved in multi-copper enzyme maturation permease subunit